MVLYHFCILEEITMVSCHFSPALMAGVNFTSTCDKPHNTFLPVLLDVSVISEGHLNGRKNVLRSTQLWVSLLFMPLCRWEFLRYHLFQRCPLSFLNLASVMMMNVLTFASLAKSSQSILPSFISGVVFYVSVIYFFLYIYLLTFWLRLFFFFL